MAHVTAKRKTPERRINIKITLGGAMYISFGFDGSKLQVLFYKKATDNIIFLSYEGFSNLLSLWDEFYAAARSGAPTVTHNIIDFHGNNVSILAMPDAIKLTSTYGHVVDLGPREINEFQKKIGFTKFQIELLNEHNQVVECMFRAIVKNLRKVHELLYGKSFEGLFLYPDQYANYHRTKAYFACFKSPAEVLQDFSTLLVDNQLTCKLNYFNLFSLCIAQDNYLIECLTSIAF